MDDETRIRIEKEAESYSNLRVWPNEVKRHCRDSYAVGAMNEHSRITELLEDERNKAIDECIDEVRGMEERSCDDAFKFAYEIVVDNLNRLKGKQP